jgi:hypothetical protein
MCCFFLWFCLVLFLFFFYFVRGNTPASAYLGSIIIGTDNTLYFAGAYSSNDMHAYATISGNGAVPTSFVSFASIPSGGIAIGPGNSLFVSRQNGNVDLVTPFKTVVAGVFTDAITPKGLGKEKQKEEAKKKKKNNTSK